MKYAVIGAGVLGLTAALRLAQRDHHVVVLERDPVPGGLASSFEVAPGIWLERFYHHLFRTDSAVVSLIKELGLSDRLVWHRPVTTVMLDRTPRQLDSARSLLALRELAPIDRLRMAATLSLLKVVPTPRPLERATADAWMRRGCGEIGHDKVWRPLLRAKFGDAYTQVSMAWLWARIHDRTSELGYLDGGFHQLYTALAAGVIRAGGEITYGGRVLGIVGDGARLRVAWQTVGGHAEDTFDRVVSTLPHALTSQLAPAAGELAPGAASVRANHAFPPLSAHCLVLALDRPLTGIYWIGTADRDWPFVAVVEHTAMLPVGSYGGMNLVYLGAYRDSDHLLAGLAPGAQLATAGALLRTLYPGFQDSWVTNAWSFTAPYAQPIVDTTYRRRIPGFSTDVPGLYNASMFQVYPHDRGQNYSIELAHRLVSFLDSPVR